MRDPLREVAPGDAPCWIISVGKASHGMARAIVGWLADHDRAPAGGIVIGVEAMAPAHPALHVLVGDHPIPGAASEQAARAVADLIAAIPEHADVHVAISGGASALMAGPLPPLSMGDVRSTFESLVSSGLDIGEMNAVRKRVTRWSAGRLALALAPRRLHVWIISDVIGDDPGDIASGPCTGDRWTGSEVRELLIERKLIESIPAAVQRLLPRATPTLADPWLASIMPRIVATNLLARQAAAAAAMGVRAIAMPNLVRGEAAAAGRELAIAMGGYADGPAIRIWGGETTVTIVGDAGIGGRSQELALAAAEVLRSTSGVLLAAGTDGRDGPTDAAGALVDGATWRRIELAGREPATDLRRHDSYIALNAAGALIKTGPSGTNVMDLVLAATGWG